MTIKISARQQVVLCDMKTYYVEDKNINCRHLHLIIIKAKPTKKRLPFDWNLNHRAFRLLFSRYSWEERSFRVVAAAGQQSHVAEGG